jgi:RNA polymerase sigma-70 factor (ECF subfamily)
LVEHARAGDHRAFGELIDVEGDGCYAIAFRILRDADRAQDAVQDAFLTAWRDLPQLRDAERFKPWLHRLLVRACYAEARRFRRWSSKVKPLAVDPVSGGDFTVDVVNRDAIDRAFGRLSPQHRAVLVFHYYVGLPVAVIADVLDVPVGTVKSRLHHATRGVASELAAAGRVAVPEERPA